MPPLGVLYMAANIRKHGFSVSLIDAEGARLAQEEITARICELAPKILGITATTLSIHKAGALAEAVKQCLPETCIVAGGPHATALPMETLKQFKAIDAVIIGEGEHSILQLAQNVMAGRGPGEDIDGVAWRVGENLFHSPCQGFLQDLDSLPMPAWDLLEGFPKDYRPPFHSYRRLPVANIITSRGCPGACTFCDRSVSGRKVRYHSVDYVLKMIEHLATVYGIREFSIKDDMFITPKSRVLDFCRELKRRNLDITWSCNARVNSVNEELLRTMKDAGCWMISYGIESGSEQMLKKMMKGVTKEQIVKALTMSREHGIVSKGFFMIGIPGETEQSMRDTLDFLKSIPLDEMNVNFFTPFPGSKLYEEVIAEGHRPDFPSMSMQSITYVPKGLNAPLMKKYQKEMIISFYVTPPKILLYLKRALTDVHECKRLWRSFKLFVNMQLCFNKD